MQGKRTRRTRLPILPLLAFLAAVAVAAAGARAGWDGTQEITLGDRFAAEFAGDPLTEVHEFGFYAPAGTVLTAKIKVSGDLVPEVRLLDEGGVEVPLGGAASSAGIANFPIPSSGKFALRLRATSGTGTYLVTTKGKYPTTFVHAPIEDACDFEAVAGSFVSAKIKRSKGSSATPVFTGLDGPAGPVDIGAEAPVVKKIPLGASGDFEFSWRNDGAPGDVDALIKVKAPKSKRFFSFGAVEPPTGIPDAIRADWLASAHADRTAEAFNHWNEDGSVSTSCAKCHSSYGYQDYLGADGSAFGTVDQAAALGSTVDCNACHNSATATLDSVTFPSGLVVDGLDAGARCMQCHQGRESTASVNTYLEGKGITDEDGVSSTLGFRNVHYLAAGATLMGDEAQGGYQYAGKTYPGRFTHVASKDSCVECHSPHSLELRFDDCATCHAGATSVAAVRNIRMTRTVFDYDGDGNTTEGVRDELDTLATLLHATIRDYAATVAGKAIVYDSHSYPYWFADENANGTLDAGEGSYKNFTPRLVKATYNLQYYYKDPGAYAHNARYAMALLYDSLESLDSHDLVAVPGFATLHRNEAGGHFDYASEAYRHWDGDGEVSASCAQCHSAEGFRTYVKFTTPSAEFSTPLPTHLADGMNCESCHEEGADFGASPPALRSVSAVWFPSGRMIENTTNDPSFTCMTCHQGRESKTSVDAQIATGTYKFLNVHYLPAGATLYGSDAGVGYEYAGKSYEPKWTHFTAANTRCSYCHLSDHSFEPKLTDGTNGTNNCKLCHATGTLEEQRLSRAADYDSDPVTTTLKAEVEAYADRLYEALQAYAAGNGTPLIWDGNAYPYFFKDTNGNGQVDAGENVSANSFKGWDPALMKAAFNFQFEKKEHGAWAHNTKYILQLLYDSIEDLAGDTTGLARP